ncbi:hypothetical protein Plec18170_000944 [Paecilomyces lecythidis]
MDYLQEHIMPHLQTSSMKNIQSLTTAQLSSIRTAYLDPYIIQPLSSLLASSTPDLVSVLLLALILLISLKVLDYARRVIMFWITLAFRLVFWGTVIGVAYYVYTAGVDKTVKDLGWLWGVAEGFVEDFVQNSSNSNAASGGRYGSGSGYGYGYGAGKQRYGYGQGSRSGYGKKAGRGW